MTTDEFLKWVAANTLRVREYRSGGDGSGGGCDCVGLVIGAWRLAGKAWPWTHGSNYAARHRTRHLAAGMALKPGDLVYKARPPGSAGYSLPDTYRDDPDRNDYYHIGIVTAVDPLTITHCTSVPGGIKEDHGRGEWKYSGQLDLLEDEEIIMSTKFVYAATGKTVNMRAGAKLTAGLIRAVPIGSTAEVLGTTSTGWSAIEYNGQRGYMLSRFLVDEMPAEEDPQKPDKDIDRAKTALYKAREQIDEALALISPAG